MAEFPKTPSEARVYIEAGCEPLGTRPADYNEAGRAVARAMLIVADAGEPIDDTLYDSVEARWPGFDDWLGGATLFMVGWAQNVVRYIRT